MISAIYHKMLNFVNKLFGSSSQRILKKYSSIVIITHPAKELFLNNSLKQLMKKNFLIQKPKLIRIEKV